MTLPDHPEEEIPPFEVVYERYAADVYRFCLIQLRNAAAAEDVTAEVFAAALAAYQRVRPSDGVKFWLLRIARNIVTSQWRRESRWVRVSRLLRGSPSQASVQQIAEVRAELEAVVAATGRLRPRDRILIGLRSAGLSSAEVAKFLHISESAAKVATHRALKALRAQLEDY